MSKGVRKVLDWEAIEREFRAGQLSLREIGRRFGLTEGAIRKRAGSGTSLSGYANGCAKNWYAEGYAIPMRTMNLSSRRRAQRAQR